MIDPHAPLLVFEEIDTTNEEARRRALSDPASLPAALLAYRQTAGRGRRGRAWASLPGNLAFTYAGRTTAPPAQIALLGFAAGVALAEEAQARLGPGIAALKWPNDMLLAGAKAAGVLIECGALAGETWFALGIGANLARAPGDAGQPTAAFNDFAPAPAPEEFACALLARLAAWSARLERDGFAPVRAAWLAHAAGLNETIRVNLGAEQAVGRFAGLSDDGALMLDTGAGGLLLVAAGDIYFPERCAA